jgi:OOP family OmpA-OmpF porin
MTNMKSVLAGAMVASAICALCPAPASAQTAAQYTTGPYVSLGVGPNFTNKAKTSGSGIDTEYRFDTGIAGAAAVGYGLGNGVRVEGEIGYRKNDVDKASTGAASGTFRSYTFMLNGLYDLALGWPVTPYFGGGIGLANVRAGGVTVPGSTTRISDSQNDLAYQAIGGLSYPLTDHLKLDASYRFLGAVDPDLKASNGGKVDTRYTNHTVLLGLRWEFGAPARPTPAAAVTPPPPPAPAAPVQAPRQIQRSYLVFFDFDKSDVTPEAQRVIQQAATNAKEGNVSRIQATGHADRAGPDRYNMALSIRRANAVKASLVRQGIPENQIVVIGKGETEPLVPTPDGVREPQNRRVEILLQ